MKVAICILDDNDKIKAKHEIQAGWGTEVEHAAKLIGVDVFDEIGKCMLDSIKKDIDALMIAQLLKEAKENSK